MRNPKPLGRKSYGSIPHLPNSRLGPRDYSCHVGQERICTTKARDKHDRIIVTEKLDGSNVGIAKLNGEILAVTRAGYLADTSPFIQHHFFKAWVEQHESRFVSLLNEGERICGEWLAQAHGTIYHLAHEPFVTFDIIHGSKRLPWDEVVERANRHEITLPRLLSDGPPISVESILPLIEISGHGATEEVEGAVWRVERKGEFDYMAKWVRQSKKDGKYLPEISGGAEVWMWKP